GGRPDPARGLRQGDRAPGVVPDGVARVPGGRDARSAGRHARAAASATRRIVCERSEWRRSTVPPARDLEVARTERSPDFGRAAGLPGFPVASSRYDLPVTVAGPRRTCTGFRGSPFAYDYES